MTTTIFATGDWHADWHTDGYERFADVEEAVEDLMEAVESAKHEEGINDQTVLLFGGDLANPLSRNVHRAVALAVRVALECERLKVRALFMTGNHDVQEDGRGSHTLLAVKELTSHYVDVVESPGTYRLGTLGSGNPDCIFLLPFTANALAYDPTEVLAAQSQSHPGANAHVKVIAGHLSLRGIIAGSETTSMPRGRNVEFPLEQAKRLFPDALLVNHHYHDQQVFEGVHIPGSLVRLTHGEEHSLPGYLVLRV